MPYTVRCAAHEDGGARGRWRSFSHDGCEQVAFLAADAHPRPTGLMIAWETSNSAVWQHEHEYVITTTKWDNYPLQVTSTCRISRVWGCGGQRITTVTILNPHPNFLLFSTIYFALLVTCPSLVPSRAARTVTRSPDKSPDGPHD